ncbi:unnamed protein product [Chrysoparadoxa australica]
MEEGLQMNETVNAFQTAFVLGPDDEVPVVKESENELKELRTFTDLVHSKNKALSAIDWMPQAKGMVAVSAVKNLTFDQRIQVSSQVDSAFILLWDFKDLIHPMLKLQSPQEAFCFKFNSTIPTQVVAGCVSGQVVLWDISEGMETMDRRKKKQSSRHGKAGDDDDSEKKVLPPQQPVAVSHIDASHRKLVADLVWLPPETQINSRGQLLGPEHLTNKSHQFITVAGDGQCLFWDTRFQEISEGQLPHIARPRQQDKRREDKDGIAPRSPWMPLFRMQMNRLEGVGELSLCRCVIGFGGDDGEDRRSQMICTTEEGEMAFADWRAKVNGHTSATPAGGEADLQGQGDIAPEFVKWVADDHSRPCVALQTSPFFPEILLSVGDWNFQLWKVDWRKPIFSSPMASTYVTTGRWSPTRPGMILLGKVDGTIDVWDFTDSSYSVSVTMLSSPSRITSMEFLQPEANAGSKAKQQLLSVGDAAGNLHVFLFPPNLSRPVHNERSTIANFLERELRSVNYVNDRMQTRSTEADAAEAEEAQAASAPTEAPGVAPAVPVEAGSSSVDEEDPAMIAEETQYKALETRFIEEMGLKEADLPPHYQRGIAS